MSVPSHPADGAQPERLLQRTSRDDLLAVAHLMRDFPAPWFVSGGWAIDAFLGEVTREHQDLEIGIARADQGYLHAYLADWRLYKIVGGGTPDAALEPWTEAERLDLPIHQIVVQRPGAAPPEFELFLNEVREATWHFRRDPTICRLLAESYLRTEQGIPVIAPEIQLLYKSRLHRPKDEHDFRMVLDRLTPSQRSWLQRSLAIYRPNDRWLDELSRGT